jgi:hypothetical protein
MKPFEQQTYYEILEVPVTATAEEIRQAHARALEVYGPDSPALYGLADPQQADALRARMLEAMEILTDDDLRVEYDRSIGLPPRPLPPKEEVPPDQLVMMDLVASAEAVQSTRPEYHVSYIPRPPRPEYPNEPTGVARARDEVPAPLPAVAAPEPPLIAISEPALAPEPPTPVGPAPVLPPEPPTPPLQALAPALPLPTVSPPVAADVAPEGRYGEVADGVIRGPRVLDSAHEMAHEAAIANAEAALAQVANRVREPRVKLVEPGADAEFNGELLRQVRESKAMSIHTLAERTRIAQRHIENVEADRYDALPAAVYLRGILMSLARELGLDALRVAKSYLALATVKRKS